MSSLKISAYRGQLVYTKYVYTCMELVYNIFSLLSVGGMLLMVITKEHTASTTKHLCKP